MIKIEKITPQIIDLLFGYIWQNNLENIINDFGPIKDNNGYGTFFLEPENPLFKVFWVRQQDGKIQAIGLGGPCLGLTLKEMYEVYGNYRDGFLPYDDEYQYAFFKSENYQYTIRISSKNKLFKNNEIIEDIEINQLGIQSA